MILSVVFFIFFVNENTLLKRIAVLIFIIAVVTDWYDGWHARKYKSVTRTGKFIDPLADKILTSSAFLAFYFLNIIPLWMIIIIILRDILITILRSYDEIKGIEFQTSYIAKVKTFIQMLYIFIILILIILPYYDVFNINELFINKILFSEYNYYVMLFITFITLYTGVSYLWERKS